MSGQPPPEVGGSFPEQAKLRAMLKDAKERGFIRDFVLRPGGRATIYNADVATKIYTTSTLDTLAALQRRGWTPPQPDDGQS